MPEQYDVVRDELQSIKHIGAQSSRLRDVLDRAYESGDYKAYSQILRDLTHLAEVHQKLVKNYTLSVTGFERDVLAVAMSIPLGKRKAFLKVLNTWKMERRFSPTRLDSL